MGNEAENILGQSCNIGDSQPLSFELRSKKLLKFALRGIQRALPAKLFDRFYEFSFPIYKEVVRQAYRCRIPLFYLCGRPADVRMVSVISSIMPYTLVGIRGLEATYRISMFLNETGVAGSFVELGVARGGCAAMLGMCAFHSNSKVQRKLWLFDSFEGLPDPTVEDFVSGQTGDHVRPLPRGSCLGKLEQVKSLLHSRLNLPIEQVNYVQGWFQDTLPIKGADIGPIALLRIDGDWYESTKVCLEYLYDQVVPGGVIIVDDYQSCYGCKRAVDEFLSSHQNSPKITLDGRGGCFFTK